MLVCTVRKEKKRKENEKKKKDSYHMFKRDSYLGTYIISPAYQKANAKTPNTVS